MAHHTRGAASLSRLCRITSSSISDTHSNRGRRMGRRPTLASGALFSSSSSSSSSDWKDADKVLRYASTSFYMCLYVCKQAPARALKMCQHTTPMYIYTHTTRIYLSVLLLLSLPTGESPLFPKCFPTTDQQQHPPPSSKEWVEKGDFLRHQLNVKPSTPLESDSGIRIFHLYLPVRKKKVTRNKTFVSALFSHSLTLLSVPRPITNTQF